MQAKARAKKSNKNVRPAAVTPQAVDIPILTKEQQETAAPRKEIELFLPVREPAGTTQERPQLASAYTRLSPDAFTHLKPLPKPVRAPAEDTAQTITRGTDQKANNSQETGAKVARGQTAVMQPATPPPRQVRRVEEPIREQSDKQREDVTTRPRVRKQAKAADPAMTSAQRTQVVSPPRGQEAQQRTRTASVSAHRSTHLHQKEAPIASSGTRKKNTQKQKARSSGKKREERIQTDLTSSISVKDGKGSTRPAAIRADRKARRKRAERLTYIVAAFVLLFLIAGFFLFRIYLGYRKSAGEYAGLTEDYVIVPPGLEAGEIGNTENESYYPDLQINFASLYALNDDFVGWIYVPGSDISYPLVQGDDNDYYLRHTFLESASGSGAIFIDCNDKSGFLDFNTFIYGHNMQDGSMFSNLSRYRQDTELVRLYPFFYIYLNGSVRKYRICSFYNDDGYSDSYLRVSTTEDKQAYIAMILAKSIMSYDTVPLSPEDSFVTLSTCQDSVTSGRRFLVHGVCTGIYQTENNIH